MRAGGGGEALAANGAADRTHRPPLADQQATTDLLQGSCVSCHSRWPLMKP